MNEEIDLYHYLYNLDTKDIIFLLKSNNYNGNTHLTLTQAINTLLDYEMIDLFLPSDTDKTLFRQRILFKKQSGTYYTRTHGTKPLKPIKQFIYQEPKQEIPSTIKEEEPPSKIEEVTPKEIVNESENLYQEIIPEETKSIPEPKIEKVKERKSNTTSTVEEVLVQDSTGDTPDKDLSYVEKDHITLKPYSYQERHVQDLIHIFTNIHNVAFNGSDPGTGKTCTTLELAKKIGFTIFCVCPPAVQEQWRREIVKYGIPAYTVSTYDILVKAKWSPIMKDGNLGSSRPFPNDKDFPRITYSQKLYKSENKTMKRNLYNIYLPPGTLVVMDESRTIKNKGTKRYDLTNALIKFLKTDTGKLSRLLFLSATAIESDRDMKTFLYIMGYISAPTEKALKVFTSYSPLSKLPYLLYEKSEGKKGVLISTADAKEELGIKTKSEIIPKIAIFSEEDARRIEQENKTIALIIQEDKNKAKKDPKFGTDTTTNRLASLANFTRARQNIETIKLPAILDQAKELIDEGYQTIVFLRFVKSIKFMKDELTKIYGEQNISTYFGEDSKKSKLNAIDDFNNIKIKCLVVSLQAGAEGINLHDSSKGGKHPRASVLNPDPLLGTLYQALGRIDRVNSTSNSKQVLIFANTDTERKFADKLRAKDTVMKLLHGARNLTIADI